MTTGKVKSIEKAQSGAEPSSPARGFAQHPDSGICRRAVDASLVPQMAGNLATQQLFSFGDIQAKLEISHPGDPLEEEADRVADHVMRMPESAVQRNCATFASGASYSKCDEENIQRKATPSYAPEASADISSLRASLCSGQPLPASVRAFFEPRFGTDFSQVQVHIGGRANEAAHAIQARAFTTRQDIVFGAGQYAPTTADGKRLLAHELAHVIQQRSEPQPALGSALVGDIQSSSLAGETLDGIARIPRLLDSRPSVQARQNAVLDLQCIAGNKAIQRWPWSKTQTPERKAYEKARDDLNSYKTDNSHPDIPQLVRFPALGTFDAQYKAAIDSLFVIVKVRFKFIDEGYQKVDEEDLARILANKEQRAPRLIDMVNSWDPAEKENWKQKFLLLCSTTWSFQHTLYCHKDWWESLKANVVVIFDEATNVGPAHSITTVHKGIGRENSQVEKGANAELNQGDIEGVHPLVAHEAGHMLGLGDEYQEKNVPEGKRAYHSDLVKAEFGAEVIRGKADPDSIMAQSGAQKVLPLHGVVFLKAIKQVTNMSEWHMSPKPPRPIPPV
jgi:hypothetical protein